MRATDTETVRGLPLFRDMAAAEFESLMQAAFLQRFPTHTVLIHEGEPADFLHIVVDGTVELFAGHRDRETTIGFLAPVSTFILAAVLVDKVNLMSARTVGATRVLMIPAEAIRAIFSRDAGFARAVVAELAERYREIVRELKDQKLRPGVERLAAWLLRHASEGEGGLTVTLPFEKGKLASRLGMTRENLSRTFSALGAYGVEASGRVIRCTDPEALRSLARPNALIDESVRT